MGARRLRVRSRRSRDSPVPTQCNQTECFDPLLRNCVSCELFHTPDTGHSKQGHGDRRDLPRGRQPASVSCSSADPGASSPPHPSLLVSPSLSSCPSLSPSLSPSTPPPSSYRLFPTSPHLLILSANSKQPGARDSSAASGGLRAETRRGTALRCPSAPGTGAGADPSGSGESGELEMAATAQDGLPGHFRRSPTR